MATKNFLSSQFTITIEEKLKTSFKKRTRAKISKQLRDLPLPRHFNPWKYV